MATTIHKQACEQAKQEAQGDDAKRPSSGHRSPSTLHLCGGSRPRTAGRGVDLRAGAIGLGEDGGVGGNAAHVRQQEHGELVLGVDHLDWEE
eukprot:10149369-Alexandrium_andersonii.AAC.1